jgi:hypothetical protein
LRKFWAECIYDHFYAAIENKVIFFTKALGGKLVALKDANLIADKNGQADEMVAENILNTEVCLVEV